MTSRLLPASLRHRGGVIAMAMAVMNQALYAFNILAARVLGPLEYGAVAALIAVLVVVSVIPLGLQATAARRIAADTAHVAQIEREILALTYRAAAAVGLALLLLVPVVSLALRLDTWLTATLVALAAMPMTIIGGQMGILQGERRWWPLATMYAATGVPRLVVGTVLVLWQPTAAAAMLAVAIGAAVPAVVGWYALRRSRGPGTVSEVHGTGPIVREVLANTQALLSFLALMNCDVVIARNVLDEHDAGLYAGGLILTKAMLFLPQFVVVVAFPAMSTIQERRRALVGGLSLLTVLGTLGVVASALLPQLALIFVGGEEYAEISSRLWLFAALGTVLSLLQLIVYAVLAGQTRRSAVLVWAALFLLLGIGLQLDSLAELLVCVVMVDGVLFVVLLAISLRRLAKPVAENLTLPEPLM